MENLLLGLLACVPFLLIGTTWYGANQTKAKDPSGANILDPGVLGGNVKCMIDYYEMTGSEVQGEVLEMGKKLPKGARVIGMEILTEKLADTCTLDVGDYEVQARYLAGIVGTTPTRADTSEALYADSLAYECDETYTGTILAAGSDRQIIIVFLTLAATLVTGARVTLVTYYTHE